MEPSPNVTEPPSGCEGSEDRKGAISTTSPTKSAPFLSEGRVMVNGLEARLAPDVTVQAFNTRYRLHEAFLKTSPFFETALSQRWRKRSVDVLSIRPDLADPHITKAAFENAIKYLYGADPDPSTVDEAMELLAVSSWLMLRDLCDQCAIFIVQSVTDENIASVLTFVSYFEYGNRGRKLKESVEMLTCIRGSDLNLKAWDGMPPWVMFGILASDSLHVASEWDRYQYVLLLLNRKLAQAKARVSITSCAEEASKKTSRIYQNQFVASLRAVLRGAIHYQHIPVELLQRIRNHRDILGAKVVSDDSFQSVHRESRDFRRRVKRSREKLFLFEKAELSTMTENLGIAQLYLIPRTDSVMVGGIPLPSFVLLSHGVQKGLEDNSSFVGTGPDACPFPPFRFSVRFPTPRDIECEEDFPSKSFWYAGSLWRISVGVRHQRLRRRLDIWVNRKSRPILHSEPVMDWVTDSNYQKMLKDPGIADDIVGASTIPPYACVDHFTSGQAPVLEEMRLQRNLLRPWTIRLPHEGASRAVPAVSEPPFIRGNDVSLRPKQRPVSSSIPYIDGRRHVAAYCHLYSNLGGETVGSWFQSRLRVIDTKKAFHWTLDLTELEDQLGEWRSADKWSALRLTVVLGE